MQRPKLATVVYAGWFSDDRLHESLGDLSGPARRVSVAGAGLDVPALKPRHLRFHDRRALGQGALPEVALDSIGHRAWRHRTGESNPSYP